MNSVVFLLLTFIVAILFALLWMKVWYELTNETFMRIKDFTAGDRGRLTQRKADYLNEREARSIYGDAEVDRFLKYGDYDPPENEDNRIYPS